jgi:glycosidase
MTRRPRIAAGLLTAICASAPLAHAQDFKKQVIYQIVTDRFLDGDTSNDNPSESAGLYDATKTNWFAYWGGDLAGIQQKLAYIKGLGATAIWISPSVDNENLSMTSSSVSAPYHAYDARDFMRVEEHFGDGSNSWTAFDSLISAAHQNGMKVILDWANNHSNYNAGGEQGALYNNGAFMASANNDPNGLFHHNPDISDYNDRCQLQYDTLVGLTDLNQENATVDPT